MAKVANDEIVALLDVSDTEEPTYILGLSDAELSASLEYVKVDGKTLPSVVGKYLFQSTGTHELRYKLKNTEYVPSEFFGSPGDRTVARLRSVIFPDGIKSFGIFIFLNCRLFVNVKLPQTLETIGQQAFRWCESLTEIELPASLNNIGQYCFYDSIDLQYIHLLSPTPPTIGPECFDTNKTFKIYVGDGASAAGDDAILAAYLNDPSYFPYLSRLDTWYNFLHT